MSDDLPPWMDKAKLAWAICASDRTIDAWVVQGILPAGRMRGGKLMWKWSEVDRKLTLGSVVGSPDQEAEEVRNGAREEARARRH